MLERSRRCHRKKIEKRHFHVACLPRSTSPNPVDISTRTAKVHIFSFILTLESLFKFLDTKQQGKKHTKGSRVSGSRARENENNTHRRNEQ